MPIYISLGHGDTKCPPDGHKDEIFMEKYRAIDVSFDEIVLLCEPLVPIGIYPQHHSLSFVCLFYGLIFLIEAILLTGFIHIIIC